MAGWVAWMAYGLLGKDLVNKLSFPACHSIMEQPPTDIRDYADSYPTFRILGLKCRYTSAEH
jgi:hypothetical protein